MYLRRLLGKHQLRALFSAYSANAAGRVTAVLLQLVLIPLLLIALGAEGYGVMVLYNTLIASGMLLDMGMGQSVAKFVAEKRNKAKLLRQVINSSFFVYTSISLLFSSICIIFYTSYIYLDIDSINVGSINLEYFLTLCGIGVFPYMYFFLLVEIIRGLRRYQFLASAEVGQQILSQSTGCLVALTTKDPILVIGSQILVTSLVSGLLWLVLKYKLNVTVAGGFSPKYYMNNIFPYSRGVWLQSVFSFIAISADRFIVAGNLGVAVLGYYNIALSAASGVMGIITQGAAFVTPLVAGRLKDIEWCRMVFERVILGLSTVSSLAALVLTIFGHILLTLWIGEGTADKVYYVFVILLWFFAFQSTNTAHTSVVNVIGKIAIVTKYSIAYAVGSTFATVTLGLLFGLPGVLSARIMMIVFGLGSRFLIYRDAFFPKQSATLPMLTISKLSLPLLVPAILILPWAWKTVLAG